jgi:FkbM family methyltransferase
VRRGDAVVDAGANWGLYAARMAALAGPEGRVDAFEPHPDHADTLHGLARRHPQLAVHVMALSDAPGRARLHVPIVGGRRVTALASLGGAPSGVPHDEVEVPVGRLDDVLGPGAAPTFVKCDVEGAELGVLRGGEAMLRRAMPALLVEIEQRHQDAPIAGTFEYLLGLGYAGWYLGPHGLAPLAGFDVERDQLAHLRPGVVEYGMPEDYVADFFFAGPGGRAAALAAAGRV